MQNRVYLSCCKYCKTKNEDSQTLINPYLLNQAVFVGCQLCWKDHLDFSCHAVYMDGWMM